MMHTGLILGLNHLYHTQTEEELTAENIDNPKEMVDEMTAGQSYKEKELYSCIK